MGDAADGGETFSSVESVKAVSEIYAPANGEVTEANATLQDKPETINSDPHGEGWLVKVKLANPADVNELMDATAYEAYIAEKRRKRRPDALSAKEPSRAAGNAGVNRREIDRRIVFVHS